MAAESSTASSSSRSGGGEPSADSLIGSLISLTSKGEIRYEGILHNINIEESNIGLSNVRSLGTEGRKKDGAQVPPSDKNYEYILFRGTDIKDLQVKAAPPPILSAPSVNNDPAIIQSQYLRPTTTETSLVTAPTGSSLPDLGFQSAQMGLPGTNSQCGLPLYQPGGSLNSWGPFPPSANGIPVPLPMYWHGFYGRPNGLPQLPQQSLLQPPPRLPIAHSMLHMQFSGFNSSLPMASSSLHSSNFPDYHSLPVPSSMTSSLTSCTTLPASTLSSNVRPLQPASLASKTVNNLLPNNATSSSIPTTPPSSRLPSLAPSSVRDNAETILASGPAALPQQNASQPVTSVAVISGSGLKKTPTQSLVIPGQLLASGRPTASVPQPLQTTQKGAEVAKVSPRPISEPSVPALTESQPLTLPLLENARPHKSDGGGYYMRNNLRGHGGRGAGISPPLTKFTEDLDFAAMNEKFNKDEVWDHLGKSNRSQSTDKAGNRSSILPKTEIKPVYSKDGFFDSLSCNAWDYDPNRGRTNYSEQMKLDTETFGVLSRFRGGRRPGRGGGQFHRSHGRGHVWKRNC